jgi:hypothetical protein
MNLRSIVIASAASASGDALILRSAPLRVSRRMAARGPWFETALTRLLTMRFPLQLAITASVQRQTNEHER